MRTNTKAVVSERTHEGAPARRISPLQELRRTVSACLLWEASFYESGSDVATRIAELVKRCRREDVAALAVEARTEMHLRHVPLLLARELARERDGTARAVNEPGRGLVRELLAQVIQRPDELAEFLSLYWQDGRKPIARQVKRGLGDAFKKFSEYQLAKYNRPGKVKLRDVLFLAEPKPVNEEQRVLWKRLAARAHIHHRDARQHGRVRGQAPTDARADCFRAVLHRLGAHPPGRWRGPAVVEVADSWRSALDTRRVAGAEMGITEDVSLPCKGEKRLESHLFASTGAPDAGSGPGKRTRTAIRSSKVDAFTAGSTSSAKGRFQKVSSSTTSASDARACVRSIWSRSLGARTISDAVA